ncbi:hypothetical protein ONE63_009416 [Megalurothrips usitatus]|uniref:Uncharacterized protein n=1 Tax=Megalurothrips usitatus TaxID=439358 RepID=A0AAV7XN52_9NEOP|nr:hypothetical protein ONE63_009416 [Megalurothrips usitatus]
MRGALVSGQSARPGSPRTAALPRAAASGSQWLCPAGLQGGRAAVHDRLPRRPRPGRERGGRAAAAARLPRRLLQRRRPDHPGETDTGGQGRPQPRRRRGRRAGGRVQPAREGFAGRRFVASRRERQGQTPPPISVPGAAAARGQDGEPPHPPARRLRRAHAGRRVRHAGHGHGLAHGPLAAGARRPGGALGQHAGAGIRHRLLPRLPVHAAHGRAHPAPGLLHPLRPHRPPAPGAARRRADGPRPAHARPCQRGRPAAEPRLRPPAAALPHRGAGAADGQHRRGDPCGRAHGRVRAGHGAAALHLLRVAVRGGAAPGGLQRRCGLGGLPGPLAVRGRVEPARPPAGPAEHGEARLLRRRRHGVAQPPVLRARPPRLVPVPADPHQHHAPGAQIA